MNCKFSAFTAYAQLHILVTLSFNFFPFLILMILEFQKKKSESRSVMSDSLQHHGVYSPWNSQG